MVDAGRTGRDRGDSLACRARRPDQKYAQACLAGLSWKEFWPDEKWLSRRWCRRCAAVPFRSAPKAAEAGALELFSAARAGGGLSRISSCSATLLALSRSLASAWV